MSDFNYLAQTERIPPCHAEQSEASGSRIGIYERYILYIRKPDPSFHSG